MRRTHIITVKKIESKPRYVAGMPKIVSLKQKESAHEDSKRQRTYGQTSSVMVVPHKSNPTTAWDCCIRQYCRITHFRNKEGEPSFAIRTALLRVIGLKETDEWNHCTLVSMRLLANVGQNILNDLGHNSNVPLS